MQLKNFKEYIMKIKLLTLGLFLSFITAACGYSPKEDGLYAIIKTSEGEMAFKLYYDKTPITVGNFVALSEGTRELNNPKTGEKGKRPFYDGLIFHRIIKGFMIQGGCPFGNGRGNPGYSFVDEIVPELHHDCAGILSMANSGPNTNGSQFFITLAPTHHLDGKHTVFGRIVNGQDVLQKIGQVQTITDDKPLDDVVIKSVRIVRVGKAAKEFDAEKAFAGNAEILKKLDEEQEQKIRLLLVKLGVPEKAIVKTDSNLRYSVKRQGWGKKPNSGDTIVAHYTGYLVDGTSFDSSYKRGNPFETQIGVKRVIPGWDEAFLTMREGEKRILIIPFDLAYGEQGHPPVIPARATLIFEVELIKVK